MSLARLRRDWWPYVGAFAFAALSGAFLWGAFNAVLATAGWTDRFVHDPAWQWQAGWAAIAFYVAWWIVFFSWDVTPDGGPAQRKRQWYESVVDRPVLPLPTFLEFNTIRRDPLADGPETALEQLQAKASSTIQTISAILGFALLIFSLTITLAVGEGDALSPFQTTLTTGILSVQIVAVIAFVIGMDAIDTSTNRFIDFDVQERYRVTRYYYRTGIYYYYRGLVILLLSALLSTMLVDPIITVVGVAVFAVLGYDYWFGYAGGQLEGVEVTTAERTRERAASGETPLESSRTRTRRDAED